MPLPSKLENGNLAFAIARGIVKGISLSCLLLIAAPVHSAAAKQSIHEFVFDNGLKLLVKEDHRSPVVVSQIWYKVGGSYEYDGITGVSHALEHMMFKGTKRYPTGEFSRIIAEHGGRENAFTGRDYTAYFQRLEKSRLPISFELEADRMRSLLLPEEEFAKEIRVVMEERRLRTEDKPQSLTYEQFQGAAFISNPYRNPIIGWMSDLETMQIGDLREWYQQWYAPNNATLVVVGDVEPAEVHALAKQHFAGLPTSEIKPPKARQEPKQLGKREIVVKAPAQLPYIVMGYKVPTLVTSKAPSETYALEVLAGILDGGESARFAKELVRGARVAASAGAGYDLIARMDSLFILSGTPAQGKTIDELRKALLAQVDALKASPVSEAELARVKAQVIASDVYEKDSVFYQAMQIGMLETVGLSYKLMDEYVEQIKNVSAAQIQAVAKKYLVEDQLTVAVLDPLPMQSGQAPKSSAVQGVRHGH